MFVGILVNENTRALVSGITGRQGSFHARLMARYGTKLVAGVSPNKPGGSQDGIPVFATMEQAAKQTGANAAILFVPPAAAAESILEAGDAGMDLTVCITEGIPVQDMLRVKRALAGKPMWLIGPNCPGVITPGTCQLGIMPGDIHKPGRVGVVSRSGTLTYEAVAQLTRLGIGQSTVVGIGGDPIKGLGFIDVLTLFANDPLTVGVVMIGEIGGSGEEEAAHWVRAHPGGKPIVAFIAGLTAPPGKRMGHAGAMISGGIGAAQSKLEALSECGIPVAGLLDDIGPLLKKRIADAGLFERELY